MGGAKEEGTMRARNLGKGRGLGECGDGGGG